MNKIVYSLLFILTACGTAPIVDPPAHACSPRLDGEPTFCPDPNDPLPIKEKVTLPKEEIRGEIDVYNPIHWEQFQYMYLRNRMLDRLEKNMTQPNDSVNTAIEEYMQEYK